MSAGAELAGMRKKEPKKCPVCGEIRLAVVRALDTCVKCRDRIRKQLKSAKGKI